MFFEGMPGSDDTPLLLDQEIVHQELPGSRQVAEERILSRKWKGNRNQGN